MAWITGVPSVTLISVIGASYYRASRRGGTGAARVWCFGAGLVLWLAVTVGPLATAALQLFWVRALQVLVLLYIAPLMLANGTPVTVWREGLPAAGAARIDRFLATRAARVLAHPVTTSAAMLATPWVLYLTGWYAAALRVPALDLGTQLLLVVVGFGYFYARLQADPVPRRYPQLISIVISIVETLGDGLLGVVLWLGPLIATDYYRGVGRTLDARLDQSIGAGILWILGDLVGLPFLLLLLRAFAGDDRERAAAIDAELDRAAHPTDGAQAGDEPGARDMATLWWLTDPQLRDRLR